MEHNIQNFINAMSHQQRMAKFAETEQLTLGELIVQLQNCDDEKVVRIDGKDVVPTSVGSWRGSYRELAIRYDEDAEAPSTADFRSTLEAADGSVFRGYKGGEFTMSSATPVWVANRGEVEGFQYVDEKGLVHQGVTGVEEQANRVVIKTNAVKFT